MGDKNWNLENTYADLAQIFYSKIDLNPVSSPQLLILNRQLAEELGLNIEELTSPQGVEILAGNRRAANSLPLAQAYSGHQFGHYAKLGDGRALLIGEQITPEGRRYDIQLKGSGRTPYSRGGDGRASLGPMLREYLISEAMHHLGVATSRSLAVVTTGEKIYRGDYLDGAILTRVASSHIRIGSFQYISQEGDYGDLKSLADYSIKRHYPQLWQEEKPYLAFLRSVIESQAATLAQWQLIGFVHGVMNTDNMTISGESIDYGPCAFMDNYDLKTVFSSIDRKGRYAYGNQPRIGAWNLARFAESLLPLLDKDRQRAITLAEEEVKRFMQIYYDHWFKGMRRKLGLIKRQEGDKDLIVDLLRLMEGNKLDYTNSFLALSVAGKRLEELLKKEDFKAWYGRWQARLEGQEESLKEIRQGMKKANPFIIARNHLVEEALQQAEVGDMETFNNLLKALSRPYDYSPDQEIYTCPPKAGSKAFISYCGT